ncbi:MAG: lytic murein transglycosylase [Rhodospirillales bacterium]|nr:lytic murein transglycosylase [Alphaproteobacteria bacterium]MCB9987613.1 lytic murein transglycosylase [Rhodospirillales bacterium]USO07672.1 MAG: lytic murein transglycosylase [Rhodospirillales bacterium]
MRRLFLSCLTAAFCVFAAPAAPAQNYYNQDYNQGGGRNYGQDYGFSGWLQGFRQRAADRGFNPAWLNQILSGVEFKPRVIELDNRQPEHKITFAQYRKNIVSPARVRDGRARLAQNRALLERVARAYGVAPQYIVALWGIETNFGRNTGGFDILSALATLAYEGRRASFFEGELLNALRIQAGGHAGTGTLTGSWAGAMGQCQFMPSSYLKYAVDGDGDGTANIWDSLPDVFASMANYLHSVGWDGDLRWGRAVTLPKGMSAASIGRENRHPLSYWRKKNIRTENGDILPKPADGADPMAAIVAPDGPGGPAYLVYGNYDVIMHWNRSTYFATSVGLLADAIAAGSR